MASQAWNLFDGLPGTPPHAAFANPLLLSQRATGWGGLRGLGLGLGLGVTPAGPDLTQVIGMAAVAQADPDQDDASRLEMIVGPIIAGVTMGLMLLFSRKGPKQKVATTKIVNDVEPLLRQNVDAYLAGDRTPLSQTQALANFDAGWQYVLDNCGATVMGDPGQRCISERMEGATPHWDACPVEGCRNWFQMYRDPIRDNPPVAVPGSFVTDPMNMGPMDMIDSLFGTGGGDRTGAGGINPLWLLAGGLVVMMLALD